MQRGSGGGVEGVTCGHLNAPAFCGTVVDQVRSSSIVLLESSHFLMNISFAIAVALCAAGSTETPQIDPEAPFPRQLSVFNLFRDAANQISNPGLVPYDVITPLFSDYSEKIRFVYVPEGESAVYRDDGSFEFSVGSALVKTFAYPHDRRNPELGMRLIETRVMIYRADGWEGAAYAWNEAQSEAQLVIGGRRVDVSWIHDDGAQRATSYYVPNMNQCTACHRPEGVVEPLGFRARQINRDYDFGDGARNQLAHMQLVGMLKGVPSPDDAPRAPAWDDNRVPAEMRARTYLDVNCAHCHNPAGLASHTQLDLRYTQDDPNHRGILKRPTSAGRASANMYFAIIPGRPDASFLLHRLESAEPAVRMPQIGRTIPHDEGVALIREWIASLNAE